MKSSLTISDIAKSAGVSKTTVSRFLNGKYEYMSQSTRERIESIIRMADYRPNTLARSLKSSKSMLAGLVIADIESPFSAAVIKGAGDTLRGAGYSMIIVNSDNSIEKEQKYIRSLLSQGVDGLMVNTANTSNPFLIDLANQGLPVVLTDRCVHDYNFDIVSIENKESIITALRHLMEMGYKKTALFTQPADLISPRFERRASFVEHLTSCGVQNPEQYVFELDFSKPSAVKDALKRLNEISENTGPPAVIAASGVTLLHTLHAVNELGLNAPRDIGICGFDDWGWAPEMAWVSLTEPKITTLSVQAHRIGEKAAELLLRRISDPAALKESIAIPAELIVRGSTLLNSK